MGFGQIVQDGYYFTGSESSITTTFFIVTVVHLIHLAGGVISLLIIIYNHFKQKYNSGQTLGIELVQCTGTS
jgi:cytochrome c oxidase subunit 3